MNQGPLLFLGIFLTLASSFWGLVLVPAMRIGHQGQVTNIATGALYPSVRGGLAKEGAEVYRSLGCLECHSQDVRGTGADLGRWGARMTVAQDYLGDYPVLLGRQRIGPDLANIGLRQPNPAELMRKLYAPQTVVPGSIMPSYRFLFEKRKLRAGQKPEPNALEVENGYQIVPRAEAQALVGYLVSLRIDTPLFEAPLPNAAARPAVTASNTTANAAVNVTNLGNTNLPLTNPPLTNLAPRPSSGAVTSSPAGGSK